MVRQRQEGITAVELAIILFVVLWTIFAVIDLSRVYYTVAVLDDVTRRGARLAAVCPVGDAAITEGAVLNRNGGTASPLVPGLDASHVLVDYLNATGGTVNNPGTAGFGTIEFVRVRIDGATFQILTLVPGFSQLLNAPEMETIMPRESLGIPRDGVAAQPC